MTFCPRVVAATKEDQKNNKIKGARCSARPGLLMRAKTRSVLSSVFETVLSETLFDPSSVTEEIGEAFPVGILFTQLPLDTYI